MTCAKSVADASRKQSDFGFRSGDEKNQLGTKTVL